MIHDWTQWWCQQFNYGSCAAMPIETAVIVWAGAVVVLGVIGYVIVMAIASLFINRSADER